MPVRLDLFGDEIETIKPFDPTTQRTEGTKDHFILQPATEFFLDEESISRFRGKYRDVFGIVRRVDPLYEAVSEGRRHSGMDHWIPFFFDKMETLFDYIPDYTLTLDYHAEQSRAERLSQIADFYQARKSLQAAALQKQKKDADNNTVVYHPVSVDALYIPEDEWRGLSEGARLLSPFTAAEAAENAEDAGGKKGRDFADIRALPDGNVLDATSAYIAGHRQDGRKSMIATYSEGSRDRLMQMMQQSGFANFKMLETAADIKALKANEIGMGVLGLAHGFIAYDIIVLTEQDILGDRLVRKAQKKRKADNFLTEVSSLSPGDLVVHMEHGIGRFEGLETLEAAGTLHDCLRVTYAGDDRLFVPVENIEVLSRFGSDEGTAPLDKMGGAGWQARKARVKKDLMRIADHLLKIAAQRELQKGEPLHIDPPLYNDFAARFPFQETDDQLRSIESVIEDLSKDKPMDRLVCGDVGFGKTEVALRAAYVAAMNGAQVALVVPTTLLARQHYATFAERFKGTGIRVAQLSRLVSGQGYKAY